MPDNWSPWSLAGLIRVTHAVRNGQLPYQRTAMCGMPVPPSMRRTPSKGVNCTGCRAALNPTPTNRATPEDA